MSLKSHRVHHVENPLTEPGPSHFSDATRAKPKPEGASSLESEGSNGKVLQKLPVGHRFRPSPTELQEDEAAPPEPLPVRRSSHVPEPGPAERLPSDLEECLLTSVVGSTASFPFC